jgi:hypothetical protein
MLATEGAEHHQGGEDINIFFYAEGTVSFSIK